MLNAKPVKIKSTEHGVKYETIVLIEYEKHMHKIGNPVRVEKLGFLSPKTFFLGCSPDGKVVDSVCKDHFGLAKVTESVMVCGEVFKEYSSTKNPVFKGNSKQIYVIVLN